MLTFIRPFALLGQPHDPFPKYAYTGDLRAVYPLSPPRQVPKSIDYRKPSPALRYSILIFPSFSFTLLADYAETSIPVSEERARGSAIKVLSEKEIEGMRTVCKIAREVLDIGAKAIRPGITTDEIGIKNRHRIHCACKPTISLSLYLRSDCP